MRFGETSMIRASDKILNVIKELEGCSLKVYKDSAGLDTIGIGHLMTKADTFETPLKSEAAALALLDRDMSTIERLLNKVVGDAGLPQNQIDALLSFSFNVGVGNFSKSTLLKKLSKGDMTASDEFLRWVMAGGRAIEGLIKRRIVEQGIFISSTSKLSEHSGKVSAKNLSEAKMIIEGYLYGQAR